VIINPKLNTEQQADIREILNEYQDILSDVPKVTNLIEYKVHRVCINFKELNKITVFDPEPIMSPDNIFPKLSESQYYSTFDFSKGYWAIPMEEKSKDYTLFITSRVLMRFKVTPFGMVNSASTYNRMVRKLLDGAHDLEIGKDTNRCREISLKESKGQICP